MLMGKMVNKTELAEILGKTPQTLTTWQGNGMPFKLAGKRGTSNEYDTAEVIQWMIRRDIEKLSVNTDGNVYDLEAERSRLTHHQANKTALEEQVLRGDLIPVEKVIAVWSGQLSNMKAKLLSMPSKASPFISPISNIGEIRDYLTNEIYEVLDELANEWGNSAGNVGTGIAP